VAMNRMRDMKLQQTNAFGGLRAVSFSGFQKNAQLLLFDFKTLSNPAGALHSS